MAHTEQRVTPQQIAGSSTGPLEYATRPHLRHLTRLVAIVVAVLLLAHLILPWPQEGTAKYSVQHLLNAASDLLPVALMAVVACLAAVLAVILPAWASAATLAIIGSSMFLLSGGLQLGVSELLTRLVPQAGAANMGLVLAAVTVLLVAGAHAGAFAEGVGGRRMAGVAGAVLLLCGAVAIAWHGFVLDVAIGQAMPGFFGQRTQQPPQAMIDLLYLTLYVTAGALFGAGLLGVLGGLWASTAPGASRALCFLAELVGMVWIVAMIVLAARMMQLRMQETSASASELAQWWDLRRQIVSAVYWLMAVHGIAAMVRLGSVQAVLGAKRA